MKKTVFVSGAISGIGLVAAYEAMLKTTAKMGQQAVSPQKIAEAIIHALTNDNPKTRYVIGLEISALTTMRN